MNNAFRSVIYVFPTITAHSFVIIANDITVNFCTGKGDSATAGARNGTVTAAFASVSPSFVAFCTVLYV